MLKHPRLYRPVYVQKFETVKESKLWGGLGIQKRAMDGDFETDGTVKQSM